MERINREYLLMAVAGGIGSTFLYGLSDVVTNFFRRAFSVKVTLSSRDEALHWVMEWWSSHPSSKNSSQFCILRPSRVGYTPDEKDKHKAQVSFVPAPGSYWIRHKGKWVHISYTQTIGKTGNNSIVESISISILGRNRQFIVDIIKEAQELYLQKFHGKTTVFVPDMGCDMWEAAVHRPKRRPETVIMKGDILGTLIRDAKDFLSSEDFYYQRGIPFRRGYLLYGPPGTGKTSCVTSLAGELDLNICMINLASKNMTDDKLNSLLHDVPKNSLILLEDVDCVFTDNTNESGGVEQSEKTENHITFSGLLNAMDGVAAQEGRLMFMTTNHREKLSYTLIRPGRIDVQMFIEYATSEQAAKLFHNFYANHADVAELTQVFQKKIEIFNEKISTAVLQGHFMDFKKEPLEAIDKLDRVLGTSHHV